MTIKYITPKPPVFPCIQFDGVNIQEFIDSFPKFTFNMAGEGIMNVAGPGFGGSLQVGQWLYGVSSLAQVALSFTDPTVDANGAYGGPYEVLDGPGPYTYNVTAEGGE